MMALATRYDVSTHVDSSIVADRLPAMCGSDTLTTVVSSTSMNVANMTAIATIHGFTWGCSGSAMVDRLSASSFGPIAYGPPPGSHKTFNSAEGSSARPTSLAAGGAPGPVRGRTRSS